ncbi:glucose/sorbosone family PQQ-dependent dehydrogenase [Glycomyces xiaoerkulensis]|uniref:glucose/sorbosone family PQQ-dependent dehydrogenase n=1 Tax=Glycomyces xiaoerkulensis TaxID=2038139 RepID=UPI0018E4AA52|nr:glucose/sorbosone family PQQ-dependent dehydrogenase [Glycomyces xiaoerkulensis]
MEVELKSASAIMGALALTMAAGCVASGTDEVDQPDRSTEEFTSSVLTTGLSDPWEVLPGPDGRLWITERTAGRVTQVDPSDGNSTTVLDIPEVVVSDQAQDGLLGMALHPDLLAGDDHPFVYLSYVYGDVSGAAFERRAKIVRYTYDEQARQLSEPVDLLTGLPASVDHNAGRLVFGPDRNLYYTIGDQGNNQFGRFCEPNLAQRLPTESEVAAEDWTAYQGKILRLEPDGSIPSDNPTLDGVRSHVYSYGHRNPQGLVVAPDGRLFSGEHGPKSDDELNLIEAGGNFGWPFVSGYADDRAYVYGDWSASSNPDCAELEYDDFDIPDSVPQRAESEFDDPAFVPPLRTFFTVDSDYLFEDPECSMSYFVCWPTLAPSSLEYYDAADGVPGWADSLLLPSLKNGTVYRLPLDDGEVGEPVAMWDTVNRYRDVVVGFEPTVFYVATDSGNIARGDSGRPTDALEEPGAILEFRHAGSE